MSKAAETMMDIVLVLGIATVAWPLVAVLIWGS